MMTTSNLRIPIEHDELDVAIHAPATPRGWVVALHGLESNKDGSKYFTLADRLLPLGLGLVRFDFRGSGLSTGRFEDNNVATRLADARAVIDHVRTLPGGDSIGLFGSSMGGYVALFLAADPALDLRATVTLAAPANLDDLVKRNPAQAGAMAAFIAEYRLGTYAKVPPGGKNVLLLHCTADDVVPGWHQNEVWAGLAEPRRKVAYEGGDHRFSDPAHLAGLMDESVAWFQARMLGR